MLEEEGNVHIFERGAKRLTELTSPGKEVLAIAERILRDMENIRQVGEEFSNETIGAFSIATTQARLTRLAIPTLRPVCCCLRVS